MPTRDPFDRDELEDREILDIIPERFDADPDSRQARRAAHTRLILTVSLAVLAVMALGVAARHILFGEAPRDHQGGVPVIHADDKPIKVKPQDRGGMEVPDQDKLIYDRMAAKSDSRQGPERLLPPPEQAQEPPPPEQRPPEPVPAPPAVAATAPAPARPAAAVTAPLPPPAASAPRTQAPAEPKRAQAEISRTRPAEMPSPIEKRAPADRREAERPAATTRGGGWVVQLGAVRTEAEAKSEWARLRGLHKELAPLASDIVRVDLGAKGVFWRVRGGPLDEAQARELCAELTKRSQGCIVARK